jgi:hypothetical protein
MNEHSLSLKIIRGTVTNSRHVQVSNSQNGINMKISWSQFKHKFSVSNFKNFQIVTLVCKGPRKLSDHTVKPQFKEPAFQVFPYLRYIICGPSQRPIYTTYYAYSFIYHFSIKEFTYILHKELWFIHGLNLSLASKGFSWHIKLSCCQPCVIQGHHLHSMLWSTAVAAHSFFTPCIGKSGYSMFFMLVRSRSNW